MKKTISLLILFLAVAISSSAQFRWGAVVGANYTDLKFSQSLFSTDAHFGPQLGVQAEMMFPGIGFGIDFGAQYEMRGATLDLGKKHIWEVDGYGKEKYTGHYLTIPIDLRFKWTRMNGIEEYIAPYVFGGPVLSFQLAHTKLQAFEHKTLDFALQAGFGVELFKKWQVQGAYTWGLSDAMRAKKLTDFNGVYRYWSVKVVRYF